MRLHLKLCVTIVYSLLFFAAAAEDPIIITDIILVQETCELGNGSLTINIQGGTAGLIFSVDDGANFQTSNHFDKLKSGDYLIIVTDGNGCLEKKSAQIADAPEPTVSLSGGCLSGLNRIELFPDAQGGIKPLSFSWEGPNNTTHSDDFLTDVLPGKYSVTVTDALGCTFSDTITIDQCCALNVSCALEDSEMVCENNIPEIPVIFNSGLSKEATIQELSARGIQVEMGSCGELSVTVSDTTIEAIDCTQDTTKVVREYSISDSHTTYKCTQQYSIINSIKASITNQSEDGESLCQNDIQAEFQTWLSNYGGMTFEACSDPIVMSTEPLIPTIEEFCGASSTVSFIVEDGCGNIITSTATYFVIDYESPSITCPPALVIDNTTVDADLVVAEWLETVSAEDNCTLITEVSNDFDADLSDLCEREEMIPISFQVIDDCTLSADCETHIEISIQTLTINCPSHMTIQCGETQFSTLLEEWSATVSTEHAGSNSVYFELPQEMPLASCSEELIIPFTITNDCGQDTSCYSSIVISDYDAPQIICPPSLSIDVQAGDVEVQIAAWLDDASAEDCNDFTIEHDLTLEYDGSLCSAEIPVIFVAIDNCENESICSTTLELINDAELNISCPEPITVLCSEPGLENIVENLIAQATIEAYNPYEQSNIYDEESLQGDCEDPSVIDITILIKDECEKESECYTAIELIPDPAIFIPNVFSPDNDGLNDFFTAYTNSSIDHIKSFLIYNKWGNKVFECYDILPNEAEKGWDGIYRGQKEADDVYTYYFVLIDTLGEEIEKVGTVQILKK